MKLEHIEIVRKQMRGNIDAAEHELERFEEAARLIEPVLRDKPKWKWRDGVAHLIKLGVITV